MAIRSAATFSSSSAPSEPRTCKHASTALRTPLALRQRGQGLRRRIGLQELPRQGRRQLGDLERPRVVRLQRGRQLVDQAGLLADVPLAVFGEKFELLGRVRAWLQGLEVGVIRAQEVGQHPRVKRVTLQYVEVRASSDLRKAFDAIVRERAGAVAVFPGPALWSYRGQIAALALQNRLPTMYLYRDGPESGGLMSYGPNLRESWRGAARYVDKILRGAKPADLPVEQPTKFELVINLKTAKALGITIPQSLLLRAEEVLQ
ncbi:MAG: hypothetical protein E6G47_00315 [Actinobacteria bacterium]|nr:MAG: hypothetical protein E6G47_00315 [Actinomycetota bacterium]